MNAIMPYSYHTFIFPFLWNDGGKISRKKFATCLNPGWEIDFLKDAIEPDDKEFYDRYRYFNQAARNAMFTFLGKDGVLDCNSVVWNYRFDMQSLSSKDSHWLREFKSCDNPARYVICKGDKTYSLSINGIRMKLFNTGHQH